MTTCNLIYKDFIIFKFKFNLQRRNYEGENYILLINVRVSKSRIIYKIDEIEKFKLYNTNQEENLYHDLIKFSTYKDFRQESI